MEKLHEGIERLEAAADAVTASLERLEKTEATANSADAGVTEVKATLEATKASLKEHEDRLRALDAALPKGEKVYKALVPSDGTQRTQEVRQELCKYILDIASFQRDGRARFNCDTWQRQQTEGTTTEGGFLVPEEQLAEVVRVVQNVGLARRLLRVIKMNKREMRIPTNSAGPNVYWQSAELVAPSQSGVTFARPALVTRRLIAWDLFSLEVEEDAVPDIMDFVIDLFAEAVAKEEDRQAFVSDGTGSEPFTGLLYVASIAEVTGETGDNSYDEVLTDATAYNKLIDVLNAADENVQRNGVWVMSQSVANLVRKVKDNEGRPLWLEMVGNAGSMPNANPGTIFGRPYFTSFALPKVSDVAQDDKPFILYGDMKYHAMGDRREMTVDTSTHAAFKEAGVILRVTERVAFTNLLTGPFARLRTAA